MAKKGQVFKKYTDEEREKITLEYLNGKGLSLRFIGDRYHISRKTIGTWARKYRKYGTTLILKKKGRPKTSNLSEIERLKLENEILKKYQAFLNHQQERR